MKSRFFGKWSFERRNDNSNDWSDIMDTYSKTMEYFGGKSKCRRSWKESEGSVIPQFNIVAPHRYTIDLPPRLISLSTEERKGGRSVRWDGSSCICEPSNHFSVSSGTENVRSTRSTRIFSRFERSLRVDSLPPSITLYTFLKTYERDRRACTIVLGRTLATNIQRRRGGYGEQMRGTLIARLGVPTLLIDIIAIAVAPRSTIYSNASSSSSSSFLFFFSFLFSK